MRELLQQALALIETDSSTVNPIQYTADVESVTAALREALSRSKWNKVSDGLPVVPEGEYSAAFWICDDLRRVRRIRIFRHETAAELTAFLQNITHWQYRQDDTPAPPEDL